MLGLAAALQGEYPTALAQQEESQVFFHEVGDSWGVAISLYWQGEIQRLRRDHTTARALHQQSLALFRQAGDSWGLAIALQGLGIVDYRQHDLLAARAHLEEALALRRQANDHWLIAQTLHTLGTVLQAQGQYEQAAARFEESLTLYRELGDTQGIDALLHSLGKQAEQQRDYARAAGYYQERLRRALQSCHQRHIAECQAALARLASVATSQGEEPAKIAKLEPPASVSILIEQRPALQPTIHRIAEGRITLHLFAFGQGRIHRGEQMAPSSSWPYAKVKELLFYLLSTRSRTKEQIGLEFWPDASPAQLRSNFHDTLYHLRQALGRPDWIVYANGGYAFNRSLDYWWDVEAFEAALARAHMLEASDPAQAIQRLEEAITLYQGDFLEDSSSEWVLQRRDELRRLVLEALVRLGQRHATLGQYTQAAEAFHRAIGRDRYLEAAHRELIRCYARQGERSMALRHYQSLVEWLREEFGSAPAPETTALIERLRRGEAV